MSFSFADFWDLIDRSSTKRHDRSPAKALAGSLDELEPAALVEFGAWSLVAQRMHNNKNPMRALGALLCGGDESDEQYEAFRHWLILDGRSAWETALRNPDALPDDIRIPAVCPDFVDCLEKVFEPHLATYPRPDPDDEFECYWDFAETRLLSRDFGQQSRRVWDEFQDCFAGEDPLYARIGSDYVRKTLPRLWNIYGDHWAGATRTCTAAELYEHYQDSTQDQEYDQRMERIEQRLAAEIDGECRVEFEVEDAELEDCAFEGKLGFTAHRDPSNPSSRDYKSEVVENPSWLEVAVLANQMLVTTDDDDHRYLEGVEILKSGPVSEARFLMGS